MIKNCLKEKTHKSRTKHFGIYKTEESVAPDNKTLDYLGEQTMHSYRPLDGLKSSYSKLAKKELTAYLINYVFAPLPDPFNVRQEILERYLQDFVLRHIEPLKFRVIS